MTWLILNFRDFLGKGGRNLGPDKTLGGRFFKKKFFFLKDLSICSKGTNFGDISIISTPYFSKPTNQGLPLSNQPLCPPPKGENPKKCSISPDTIKPYGI